MASDDAVAQIRPLTISSAERFGCDVCEGSGDDEFRVPRFRGVAETERAVSQCFAHVRSSSR